MWQAAIFPYTKSWDMYFAPGDRRPTNKAAAFHNLSYGYNYGYLSKMEVTADPSGCGATQWFSGRSATSVANPANTVMFADNGGTVFGETGSTLGSMVNPPDAWPSTEYFYGPTEVGWGKACQTYYAGTKWGDTDGFAPRYTDGGNIARTDGSAKFYKTSQAAVATNYNPNQSCTLVRVNKTRKNEYMWDPRGDAAPDQN